MLLTYDGLHVYIVSRWGFPFFSSPDLDSYILGLSIEGILGASVRIHASFDRVRDRRIAKRL